MTQIIKYLTILDFLRKQIINAKITETEVPIITGLDSSAAFNKAQYRIPNVSNLIKYTNYEPKYQTLWLHILPHIIK